MCDLQAVWVYVQGKHLKIERCSKQNEINSADYS